MNFDLSDDQRMLQDSLERLIAQPVTADAITELGLNLLPFSEDDGGLGLGPVEMMLVGEAFGRGLVSEPYLAGAVLAGTALRIAPPSPARSKAIAALASGQCRFAYAEDPQLVLGGDTADMLVVRDGAALSLVESGRVQRRPFQLHNGWGAAQICVDGAAAVKLGSVTDVAQAVEQSALVWLAGNAVGAMQAAFDLTVDFLKTREQFGRVIGTNQALQHRIAEMLVELEAARSMAIYATQMVGDADPAERARAFAAVKLVINKSARFIGQQAVQLHGGIGVCEEHRAGRYFKHLCAIELLFGDSDHHAARLAELGGFTSALPHWEAV